MDIEFFLKIAYQLFIKLPYITAFVFLISSIYHFKNGNDGEFFESLTSLGFSLIAIISCFVCFNILFPKIFNYNDQIKFMQLLQSFTKYLLQPMLIIIMVLGIVDNERLRSERLKFICLPPVFLFMFSIFI